MASVEPPSSGGHGGAVALVKSVVVVVFGGEGNLVVVIPLASMVISLVHQGIAGRRRGVVILNAQNVIPGLILDAEVVVFRPVVRRIPLLHVDVQRVGAALSPSLE